MKTLRGLLAWSLLVILCADVSPLQSSSEVAGVKVVIERVERVSRNEVHFSIKVVNTSDTAVFLMGINYESGPMPYPVFLEQWRAKEGWKAIAPCMDTPPDVLRLNPSEAMTLDPFLKVPLTGVCKERNIQLEGKFRYRLDYFQTEKQARAYVRRLFSRRWQEARAAVAVSEPFEIPVASEPPR